MRKHVFALKHNAGVRTQVLNGDISVSDFVQNNFER